MTDATHQIIVGIDGSSASKAALRWGIGEARLRGSTVTAVHAWQIPLEYGMYEGMVVADGAPEAFEKASEQLAQETVAAVVGSDVTVPVTVELRHGPASKVLVDASRDADLIVVGSEGHGAFTGMLLGSVSLHLLHHAACPVTVVRPDPPAAAA